MLARLGFGFCLGLLLCASFAVSAKTILVYGDSLSAGYGLPRQTDWPHLLQLRLQERKTDYTVVNASISGETTLGAINRIEESLRLHRPVVTIVALGANDGLRGQDLKRMRSNLETMIDAARRAKSQVVLVGMQIPPNYGPLYTKQFRDTYGEIARARKIRLVPFLLEGFAEQPQWFQADQLHPTAQAQPLILETVWKTLAPVLKLR